MLTMLAAVAELERSNIKSRQMAGIARARATGQKLGAPKKSTMPPFLNGVRLSRRPSRKQLLNSAFRSQRLNEPAPPNSHSAFRGSNHARQTETPDQAAQAVILREAGWTVSAIAARLCSTSIEKHNAVAGAGSVALMEKAREELITTAFSLDSVQQSLASLVSDDMALSRHIRTKLAEAIEALDPNSPTVFRGSLPQLRRSSLLNM